MEISAAIQDNEDFFSADLMAVACLTVGKNPPTAQKGLGSSRPERPGVGSARWWPVLALLLPLLLLFGGGLLDPNSANPFSASGDFWQLHFAVRELASESLRQYGAFPKWDPRTFGGYPLFGELSTQFFYPPSLAYGLLSPPNAGKIFLLLTVLHYGLGGWGTYLWLRDLGLSPAASVGGAWFFMLSAKWHAHALVGQHPTLGLAWLPWIARSMERMRERGAREILPLCFFLYMWVAGLSGPFLRDSIYFVFAFGLYSLFTSANKGRQFGSLLAAALLSAGLSAFYLLPAFELLGQCTRSTSLPLDQAIFGTWPLRTLATRLLVAIPVSDIGWEATLFAGVVATLLGLVALITTYRDTRTRFFGLVLIVWLFWVMGGNTPVFSLMYKFLPGLKLFRYPERVGLQLGWLAAPLVGLGLQALSERKTRIRPYWWLLLAGLCIPAAVEAAGKGWTVARLCPVLLVAGVAAAWRPWRYRLQALLGLLLLELLWVPASTVDLRPLPAILGDNALGSWLQKAGGDNPGRVWLSNSHMLGSAYAYMYDLELNNGINGYVPWVSFRLAEQGVARVPLKYEFTHGLPEDLPIVSSAYLARGNYRFVASDRPIEQPDLALRAVVNSYKTYDFVAPTGYFQMPPVYVYENQRCLPRARLVSRAQRAGGWDEAFQLAHAVNPVDQVVLETNDELPAFSWPANQARVTWTEHGADRRVASFEVPAGSGGAYLVVSEMHYPGWHARQSGRELTVYRADGAFCCLRVGEGRQEIEWEFEPTSFPTGRNISLACLAIGLALALITSRKPRAPEKFSTP